MLVEIQITVSGIQRQNNQFVEEMAALRITVKSQKRELVWKGKKILLTKI